MKIEKILREYGYNCRYTKSTKKLTVNLNDDDDKAIKGIINFMAAVIENEPIKNYIHVKNITIKS